MGQSSNRVAYAALAAALAALALQAVQLRRAASPPEAQRSEAAREPPADAEARLRSLAARVRALESQRGAAVDSRTAGTEPRPEPKPEGAEIAGAGETAQHAEPAAQGPRRFVRFELPSRALEVRQADNGALSVTNSDPALTGKMLHVKARTEDGEEEEVTILVPPPAP